MSPYIALALFSFRIKLSMFSHFILTNCLTENEIKRWKIDPQSIFDYDPIEDGTESLSLGT